MKRLSATLAAALMAAAVHAQAQTTSQPQTFALEGAVIDSRSGQSLGVINERGDINALFRAQKAMTFGILRSAGISLEQLPPDVRARIERFQTNNIEAFRAFSQGLDLKDQGKFIEAKEQFRRAAELDPGFALATEQQQSMPDVNLGTAVQARAVLATAANTAVDRGKVGFTVDLARALAALAAGQSVISAPAPATALSGVNLALDPFSANLPGSGSNALPNLVVGLAYNATLADTGGLTLGIALSNEWRGDAYKIAADLTLDSVGGDGANGSPSLGFLAARNGAAVVNTGSVRLSDNSSVYWGRWLATATSGPRITGNGAPLQAPELGSVDYAYGQATLQMPNTGSATYSPAGGMLGQASGTIQLNFAQATVSVQNLGFTIGSQSFAGLNGSTRYDPLVGSGPFTGTYSSGTCTGCTAFAPGASSFSGNFVGRDASGLIFSTILVTGSATNPTTGGVHVFTKQ